MTVEVIATCFSCSFRWGRGLWRTRRISKILVYWDIVRPMASSVTFLSCRYEWVSECREEKTCRFTRITGNISFGVFGARALQQLMSFGVSQESLRAGPIRREAARRIFWPWRIWKISVCWGEGLSMTFSRSRDRWVSKSLRAVQFWWEGTCKFLWSNEASISVCQVRSLAARACAIAVLNSGLVKFRHCGGFPFQCIELV